MTSNVAELDDAVFEKVVAYVHDRLADGPRRLSDLVNELMATGDLADVIRTALDDMAALGDDSEPTPEGFQQALTGLVDDAMIDDAGVWSTAHDDPWLLLVEQLVDGPDRMVLTHRLTEHERAGGAVPVVPDLVTLDMDAPDSLDVPGVGRLQVVPGPGRSRPGHDNSVVEGPPGWLDGFTAGDLVMFDRRGLTVEITRVVDPVPDSDLVAHLEDAAHQRLGGEEAYPLVLDAMTTSPQAFRQPARPLGELLEAAGLERRGFSWGPQDRPWLDAGDNARLMARVRLARRLASASLVERGGEGDDDEQPDDSEDGCSQGRNDAAGGEEPEDGTGAACRAGGSAGTDDPRASLRLGGSHGGQLASPKRPARTG